MTIAPLSIQPAAVTGSTAATPAVPARPSAGLASAAPSPKSDADTLELPPAPLKLASYPKSVIPEPFPPAFPEAHLPPPDPSAAEDTVTISDAARKAVASAAADGAPVEAVA